MQYVLPWAEAGILDVDANNDVVKELGKKTFAPGALNMAKKGSKIAAVPVDGWTQMVVYRKDLFDAAGLAAPDSYANIEAAIKKLHNPPNMYGFVAATKVDENFMSQVLEHVFLANGVSSTFQPAAGGVGDCSAISFTSLADLGIAASDLPGTVNRSSTDYPLPSSAWTDAPTTSKCTVTMGDTSNCN